MCCAFARRRRLDERRQFHRQRAATAAPSPGSPCTSPAPTRSTSAAPRRHRQRRRHGRQRDKLAVIGGDIGTATDSTTVSFRIAGGAGGTGQTLAGGIGGSLNGISILIDDVAKARAPLLGGAGGSRQQGRLRAARSKADARRGDGQWRHAKLHLRAGRGGDGSDAGAKAANSARHRDAHGINDTDTLGLRRQTTILAAATAAMSREPKAWAARRATSPRLALAIKGAVESSSPNRRGKSGDSVAPQSLKGGAVQGVTSVTSGHVYGTVNIAAGTAAASQAALESQATGRSRRRCLHQPRPHRRHRANRLRRSGQLQRERQRRRRQWRKSQWRHSRQFWRNSGCHHDRLRRGRKRRCTGNGGVSGNVSTVTINDFYGAAGTFYVSAGAGGNGAGAGSKGGNTGTLGKIALSGVASTFGLGRTTTVQNAGSGDALGGNGGAISGVTGNVGQLFITAADGGAATSMTGKGGNGASVNGVTIEAVSDFVRIIAAAMAAVRGASGVGGQGGSLGGIKVPVISATSLSRSTSPRSPPARADSLPARAERVARSERLAAFPASPRIASPRSSPAKPQPMR
jgi:hypothetical protein